MTLVRGGSQQTVEYYLPAHKPNYLKVASPKLSQKQNIICELIQLNDIHIESVRHTGAHHH
jgi:hypothetical protein